MMGKRVKRRLRFIHGAVCLLRFSLIVSWIAMFWGIVKHVPAIQPQARFFGFIGATGHFAIALLMNHLGFYLGRYLATRFGWLSVAEALVFDHWMYRWPECWLETRPGDIERHPLDHDGKPCRPPEHSVGRLLQARSSARSR
ncbi:hypothetical protein Enr13x_39310 [Stieleria neptunia]|uniref:Uncharacterized protein n=1 Tax=Stieleria neptunia TaxID=2527979 RepID=A0A518HT86_9BACT|nr:hypothetical protein Enr13x_39310 [Stieleria neptunia]